MIDVIAFDADDTLWHNETLFSLTQEKFVRLLANYHSPEWIEQRLYATELRNLQYFGYGIKGFTLSMIETAIELTDGQIQGRQIQIIIDAAREMLQTPVQLLEHVGEVIPRLAAAYPLMLITKAISLIRKQRSPSLAWPTILRILRFCVRNRRRRTRRSLRNTGLIRNAS